MTSMPSQKQTNIQTKNQQQQKKNKKKNQFCAYDSYLNTLIRYWMPFPMVLKKCPPFGKCNTLKTLQRNNKVNLTTLEGNKYDEHQPINVYIFLPLGTPEKAQIIDNQDGTYDVSYVPKAEGRLQVDIKYGGKPIPQRYVCSNYALIWK